MFVVRIDVAVLPHAVVGATGEFLGVEHVVEERFGESASAARTSTRAKPALRTSMAMDSVVSSSRKRVTVKVGGASACHGLVVGERSRASILA